MSTRSNIGILEKDKITTIYCHFDGYPEGVGKILFDHYQDVEKIRELMELGNLSCLGEIIGKKKSFNSQERENECLAYGRDREEDDQEAVTETEKEYFDGLEDTRAEFLYIYDTNEKLWRVYKKNYPSKERVKKKLEKILNGGNFETNGNKPTQWTLVLNDDGELNDRDLEYIAKMIKDGFTEGEISPDPED